MRYTWTLLLVLPLGVLVGSGRGERNPFSKSEARGTERLTQSPSEEQPLLSVQLPPSNVHSYASGSTSGTNLVVQPIPEEPRGLESPQPMDLSAPQSAETSSAIRLVTPEGESVSPTQQTTVPAGGIGLEAEFHGVSDETAITIASQAQSQLSAPKSTVGSYFLTQQQSDQPASSPQEGAEIPASPQESQAQSSFSDLPPVSPRRSPLFGPSIYGENRIARFTENKILLPPLISPTTNPTEIGSKKLPEDFSGDQLVLRELLREGPDRGEDWSLTAYFWHAPNTYSHPLYFEDVMLERHGHQRFPALQPFVSGGRFLATIPMLPYLMTINPACDYDYHLGHFRPGSCAPGLVQRPPYVRRAAVVQAAATAGAFIALP